MSHIRTVPKLPKETRVPRVTVALKLPKVIVVPWVHREPGVTKKLEALKELRKSRALASQLYPPTPGCSY